jgi:hypothetical protein
MTRLKMISAVALAAALLLAGCGNGKGQANNAPLFVPDPPAPTTMDASKLTTSVTLGKNVWDDYQAYLVKMGRIGGGWYAVTTDGTGGGSWSCAAALCEQSYDGKSAALKSCQAANAGKECVIFARNDVIQMKYEVAQ